MSHGCDVCMSFRPEANVRDRAVSRVSFGERVVALCEAHRRIAERVGVTTFRGLRELYAESEGRRSYVPRRTWDPLAPPDLDRRQRGRRATDA